MKRSGEAFWWSLFSAGGVVSALFLPVLVVITGLVVPAMSVQRGPTATYETVLGIVSWWPVRLVLIAVIALSFYHAAHRIRHIIIDLGWRHHGALLGVVCYGAATTGAGFAVGLLVMFPFQ